MKSVNVFNSQRILIGTKEAGAAAYFAALLKKSACESYQIYASPKASNVFVDEQIKHIVVNRSSSRLARKVIDTFKPEVIYVSLSLGNTFEKELIVEGKKRKIPVFVFLDSYLNLWQRFANKSGSKKWYYLPDRIFVINEFSKKRIINQGAPAKIVSILEHPLLSTPQSGRRERAMLSRDEVCKKLHIPLNSKIILFVSEYRFPDSKIWKWDQPSPHDLAFLLRIVVKAAQFLSEDCGVPCFVVIKKHPAEKMDRINLLSANQKRYCRSIGAFDKPSIIQAADIVAGLTSVLMSEATEQGKIVFSYHHFPSDKAVWFSSIDTKIQEMDSKESCMELLMKTLL